MEFINRYVWNILTNVWSISTDMCGIYQQIRVEFIDRYVWNLSTDMYGIYRQIRVEFIDRYVWNLLTDMYGIY